MGFDQNDSESEECKSAKYEVKKASKGVHV